MLGIEDIVIKGRVLPDGWSRAHYHGDGLPHLKRHWDVSDHDLPANVQRRCRAEVTICEDGDGFGWRLDAEDGPRQYFGYVRGTVDTADSAIAEAESAAVRWMAEPVAYPRLLRCPQSGRPCGEGPCPSPWSGCEGVTNAVGVVPAVGVGTVRRLAAREG